MQALQIGQSSFSDTISENLVLITQSPSNKNFYFGFAIQLP